MNQYILLSSFITCIIGLPTFITGLPIFITRYNHSVTNYCPKYNIYNKEHILQQLLLKIVLQQRIINNKNHICYNVACDETKTYKLAIDEANKYNIGEKISWYKRNNTNEYFINGTITDLWIIGLVFVLLSLTCLFLLIIIVIISN